MDVNHENERFFELAIQTVLHNNKHRLALSSENGERDLFLQNMSREILEKAQTFKRITDTAIREMESNPDAWQWEGTR
ncbi:hypothetical protein [Paenibacillus ginsengarvi]|uniref:DUF1657 domain-containing protein n=1 Tax=Paenibacillus ginsengarvi TaxID=400777 RepID=A0A3B0C350_9BACL|nr:hypothetical protein [Paenibacillus ginsengarvi]RKN80585.1 hypothetical protein D7M11_19055 [Paenibacillus ginsengarvi]